MNRSAIIAEIERLEAYSKKGQSYANANGSFGWRNPIRKDTGRILQGIVMSAHPKRILEIGTAHGLSALYLTSGWHPDFKGIMDTIEFDSAVAADTQARFIALSLPIRVLAKDAMEAIQSLEEPYDMVFFDAQKSHYYQQLMFLLEKKLIGEGSVILADNVIDRKEECSEFLHWFEVNSIHHSIINTECGLLIARL